MYNLESKRRNIVSSENTSKFDLNQEPITVNSRALVVSYFVKAWRTIALLLAMSIDETTFYLLSKICCGVQICKCC